MIMTYFLGKLYFSVGGGGIRMTADKIKALREAKGWTQADLARKLGITRNGVNS